MKETVLTEAIRKIEVTRGCWVGGGANKPDFKVVAHSPPPPTVRRHSKSLEGHHNLLAQEAHLF